MFDFKQFKNNKNQETYTMISDNIINATNSSDGQLMVLYSKHGKFFVREKQEFFEKFTELKWNSHFWIKPIRN